MTQSLCYASTFVDFQEYVYPIEKSTTDINALIFMLFFQFGNLGNNIFFVCSAWFLISSKKTGRRKGFLLIVTVWVVSVMALLIYLGFVKYDNSLRMLANCILPTTFSTNWFMTCYIIFLFIYPYLNKLIKKVSQNELLRIVLFTSLLWIVADYFYETLFFASRVILWVTIYFLVAYLKLYCRKTTSNKKVGLALILIGVVGFLGQVLVTNYLGLYISILSGKVLRWNTNCNPFYIMIALGSLIIALQSKFKSKIINYISGLSLFIYLFHGNYLFRSYTRPAIWQWLYTTYGYEHVVLLDLGFAFVLFLASGVISAIYKETIQRLVSKVSDKLYVFVGKVYGRVEKFLITSLN